MEIGDKIKFVFTGDAGQIIGHLPDNMYLVRLETDGDTIPAFENDIVLLKDFQGVLSQDTRKKKPKMVKTGFHQQKSTADLYGEVDLSKFDDDNYTPPVVKSIVLKEEAPAPKAVEQAAQNAGLFLAFLPDNGRYTIYLLNDTNLHLSFEFHLKPQLLMPTQSFSHDIRASEYFPIAEMNAGDIDQAEIDIKINSLQFEKKIKLKSKQFLKRRIVPLAGFEGYAILVFDKNPQRTSNDLAAYTKQHLALADNTPASNTYNILDVTRRANFKTEIDLHIEALRPDISNIDPQEALDIQIAALRKYLDEAIELHIPEFFIIHGLGKGRLREEVAAVLALTSGISFFKCEFHHKYGYGATKVRT